ncbi:hypothetical protein BO71DRAFT_401763 [Aspergillus ellipticus CBS 707.79]|uniref:F-box domain-containing protein n=1 Tax=Aspergillus ellipticus CBS 707.79 TaxID=1448320 RepID=A0A319DSA1_9EURO|nr:hypothetical protein BO71DRAFT_401763 [Aspergillus ellipticus CBS 707.79]
MHSSFAAQRALAITELRELIFRHLDWRTLLTSAQRVCRAWNTQIQDSSFLQESLFLLPVKNTQAEKTLNPILMEVFPAFFHQNTDVFPQHKDDELILTDMDLMKNPAKKPAYLRPEASWRRMLVQQPPASGIAAIGASCSPFGYGGHQVVLQIKEDRKGKDGVRMGMLFELLVLDEASGNSGLEILWWNQGGVRKRLVWMMEREATEDPDIMVHSASSSTCTDTDSDFESEQRDTIETIRGDYRSMGLQGEVLGGQWERTVETWQGMWD